jgi:HEAT repeat protein
MLLQNASGSVQVTEPSSGAGYRLAMAFVSGRFEPTIWNAGSEVAFHGKVTLQDYILDSDRQYPLTFKLVGNTGYVYLCGRGTVTTKDGKTHRLGYEETIHTWLSRLHSKDPLDREGATQALGWLTATQQEKEQTAPALIGALQDEKAEVRRNAAEALGKLKDARATEPLFAAWQDPDGWVAAVAMEVLLDMAMASSFSEERFAQLIQFMLDLAAQTRRLGAVLTGGRTAKLTVDLLLEALSNKKPITVRTAAAEALGPITVAVKHSIKDTRAVVESLTNNLSNSAEATELRIAVAKALGKIGDIRAVEPLMETLSHSAEATEVRVEAAKALGQIGDARVTKSIRDLRDGVNVEVREAIDTVLRKFERK